MIAEHREMLDVLRCLWNKEKTGVDRPSFVTNEHLVFLDDLRKSGQTNMYASTSFIEEEFGTTHEESIEILVYWMITFTQRQTQEKER